jgi:hypothetical protein
MAAPSGLVPVCLQAKVGEGEEGEERTELGLGLEGEYGRAEVIYRRAWRGRRVQ